MKKAFFAAVAALSLSISAQGGVLQHQGSNGKIEGVEISATAKADVNGRQYDLTTTGAGLRNKKVAILKVKVYVGQFLVTDVGSFVRDLDGAVDSLDNMKAVAMRMSFLRSVESEKLVDAYKLGMEANNLNLSAPDVQAFLQAVQDGGDAQGGQDMVVVGEKLADGSEVITYQNSEGKTWTVNGAPGFVKGIMSLWVGNTIEKETEELKKNLILGN
ncbi:MAG: chalcone isomerase family protein [Bdellovibrionales bacterium]|nr:chalcone isomerase family protein [Bdellovibrionales bacterium]